MDLVKQREMKELEVLQGELKNLKPGRKVYKQQPNSDVFFLADKNQVFSEAKRTLDSIQKEYKEIGNQQMTEPS